MMVVSRELIDGDITPGILIGWGRLRALAELFSLCIDRRKAREFSRPSSLLSEGRRLLGGIDVLLDSFDKAEGQRVWRPPSLPIVDLESVLGRPSRRL